MIVVVVVGRFLFIIRVINVFVIVVVVVVVVTVLKYVSILRTIMLVVSFYIIEFI